MKTVIVTVLLFAGLTYAQTCLVPAPAAPPRAKRLVVDLPEDGGTIGCQATAYSGRLSDQPGEANVGNAMCNTAVKFANQALANANGWNDGGVP